MMKRFTSKGFFLVAALLCGIGLKAQTYCVSECTNTVDTKIRQFELSNVSNFTGDLPCAQTEYSYYNNLNVQLIEGSTYTASITLGAHSGCGDDIYNKSAVLFADWNKDGDFDDLNERVGSTIYTSGTFTSTFIFTVPCGATTQTTRMRIVCNESTLPNNINSCGTYPWGETEDYNVTVSPANSPSANFSRPDTIYTNTSVTFRSSSNSGTFEWKNSDVDPSLTTVQSTGKNYTHTFTSPGNYQICLSNTNCTGTSSSCKTITVYDPTSIPVPQFITSKNDVTFVGDPVTIDFFDLSLYGATQWEWTVTPDFLGGAPWVWSSGDQTSQSPSGYFYGEGTYDVCLTVGNSLGMSQPLCKTAYIKVEAPDGYASSNQMGLHTEGFLDSGWIFDSGGPNGDYKGGEDYSFVIAPCGATSTTLNFTSFNLNNTDQLRIYKGSGTGGTLLATYTGSTIPASVTSNTGIMTLDFKSTGSNSGFGAYWTAVTGNTTPMADFSIPDTIYTCGGTADANFRNTSQGVINDQTTWHWIVEYDPNINYSSGYFDYDDFEPIYSYSSTQPYFVRLVMNSCAGSDTIVKTVVVANSNNAPFADFEASATKMKTSETVDLDNLSNGACSYKWKISPPNYSLQGGGVLTDRDISVKFTSPGFYEITLEATNANGTTTKTKANYIEVIEYCVPSVNLSNVADIGITRVRLGSIDNSSNAGTGVGHSDYSASVSTDIIPGLEYDITVNRASSTNNVSFRAWIDFNGDGDFTDAGEMILNDINNSGTQSMAAFTVPDISGLIVGETKLRVGAALGNSNNSPCGTNQVGEFEDYAIIITPDDVPPVITMRGFDTVVIQVNTAYNDSGAVAFDNLEGDITGDIVVNNTVDTSQTGIYPVFYNVSDKSGLRAVERIRIVKVVADMQKPVITILGNNPYLQSAGQIFDDPFVTAIDLPSGDSLTKLVQVSGSVDVNVIGDYFLTYEVTDAHGNVGTAVRTVQVRDTTAPVITAASTVKVQVNTTFKHAVQVTDDFDATISYTVVSGTVNTANFGSYPVVYSAVDLSGNQAAQVTVTYVVGDTVAPVFTSAADMFTIEVNNVNYTEPSISADDDYYPSVTLNRTTNLDVFTLGIYDITYTATDGSGNTGTYVRKAHVVDTKAPVILCPAANPIRWTSYDPMDNVAVLDNYYDNQWFIDNNGVKVLSSNVNIDYPGSYTVVYEATDGSGNTSTQSCPVTVQDNTTGIEQPGLENKLQVYPNPASDRVNIRLDIESFENLEVIITNVVGQTVLQLTGNSFNTGMTTVDVTEWTAGVYMIQVELDGQTAGKKIIVSK